MREILARPVIFGDVVLKLAELVEEGMLDGALIDQRTISWDVAVWVKYIAKRYNGSLLSMAENHVLMLAEVFRHDQALARKPGSWTT